MKKSIIILITILSLSFYSCEKKTSKDLLEKIGVDSKTEKNISKIIDSAKDVKDALD